MSVSINGTSGVTTPGITNSEGYTGDGLTIAAGAPAGALQIDTSGNAGLGATPSAYQSGARAFQNPAGSLYTINNLQQRLSFNAYRASDGNDKYIANGFATEYRQGEGAGIHSWHTAPSGTAGNTITFTQAMTLDASGNLLVGTTSSFTANSRISAYGYNSLSSNSTALTDQKAAMALYGICGSYNDSLSSNALVLVCNSGLAITPGDILKGYGGNGGSTLAVRIAYNGNILNTNNSYGSLSDEKVKENIVDATPKLSDLLQVKVRNFNLIDDKSKTKQIGVVAQELEEIFPNMIDMQGELKTVKYSVFVPMLIKAIQEQQAMITELKARIEQLEAK